MMGRWTGILFFVGLVLVGCAKKHPVDKVVQFSGDDKRMNAAMEKARATVKAFIAALKAPKPGQTGFSVKMPISDGNETEHFWLMPVTFDGTNFQGTINNDPQTVKTVQFGQKMTVAPTKISDWMYLENRRLVGGLTLRVMRDAMSPAERAAFDKDMPFRIE